jgi:hypothetical protein
MIEQATYLKMAEIAGRYPNAEARARYQEAARKFRYPYMDPFVARELYEDPEGGLPRYRTGLPKILVCREVKVLFPHKYSLGFRATIKNPLYLYKFATKKVGTGFFKTSVPKYEFDNNDPFKFADMWGEPTPEQLRVGWPLIVIA